MLIVMFILIFSYFFVNYYKIKKYLHMLQQNLYNENNRYIKWLWKNKRNFISLDLIAIAISLIGIFVLFDLEFISKICILIIALLFILISLEWKRKIQEGQNKKKLVITARIKRLIFTITILLVIPLIVLGLSLDNLYICWIIIGIIALITYLDSLIVFIALIINMPVEKIIYYNFKKKAQTKLKQMSNLKIIGITGSYG